MNDAAAQPAPDVQALTERIQKDSAFIDEILTEVGKVIVGQRAMVERVLIGLLTGGHVLLEGAPGLGKTTLAHAMANELGTRFHGTSGPMLSEPGPLIRLLTSLTEGDVLFIDEIHRLPRIVEEFLYPAMEDFRVDFTIEGGLSGRVVNFALRQFTLIGATTRAGMLSGAMRDRFGHRFHMDFYSTEELTTILTRSTAKLDLSAQDGTLELIAARSRCTPRVANRLLKRVRDYAQVRGDGALTPDVVYRALEIQQVDALGLDELDRAFLSALIRVYEGGPVGIEAIAATMGQERDTLEDVVEPYLLQIGFLLRTRQGRQATRHAYEHLGMPYAEPEPSRPADQPTLF